MNHSLSIHVARCFVNKDGRPELLHFMIAHITQDADGCLFSNRFLQKEIDSCKFIDRSIEQDTQI